jgi:hypothetical protein
VILGTLIGYRVARSVSCRVFLLCAYSLIVAAGAMNIAKGMQALG